MLAIPKKIQDRFVQRLKPLQAIIKSLKDKDVTESDTVTLVMDILCDLLGYDKYADLTKEHQIRSTYCDIAIQLNGCVCGLIECKAIGHELKENHTQQALNYAANKGCEWVFLTNGWNWKVYRVIFGQPIDQEMVIDFDLLNANAKSQSDAEILYALSKEGFDKNALIAYYKDQQAKDRYCIAAVLQSDSVIAAIRKELKALSPGIKVEAEEISTVLVEKVIKRDLLDGDRAKEALKRVRKAQKKKAPIKAKSAADASSEPIPDSEPVEA